MVLFAEKNGAGSRTAPDQRSAAPQPHEQMISNALETGRTVLLVEKEEDAETLRRAGVPAVRLPRGPRLDDLAGLLTGGDVAIVAGKAARVQEASREAARILHPLGATVRLVTLKGEMHRKGMTRWLAQGGTLAELEAVVQGTAPWQPRRFFRSMAEILNDPQSLRLPEAVVPNVAFLGRSTLFAAQEKMGKSTFARGMAAAVSRGGEFLGDMCRTGTCLMIVLEEHVGDVVRSLEQFGADPHRVIIVEPEGIRGRDPIGMIEKIAARVEPDLVIIDTLAALTAHLDSVPDAGDAGRWTAIMSRLTGIARVNNAAVVILHHGRRSDGRYRDSSAIGGGVDMILEVQERKNGSRKVSGRGRWPFEDFVYAYSGTRFSLLDRERSIEAQILAFLAGEPAASQRNVEAAVTGKREAIREALQKLLDDGVIEDRGSSRGREFHIATPGPDGAPGQSPVSDGPASP